MTRRRNSDGTNHKNCVPKKKYEELKEFFLGEIARRDEQIEKLKRENEIIMRTALKQSEANVRWSKYAEKLEKRLRKAESNREK